jgi:hypothetical protein
LAQQLMDDIVDHVGNRIGVDACFSQIPTHFFLRLLRGGAAYERMEIHRDDREVLAVGVGLGERGVQPGPQFHDGGLHPVVRLPPHVGLLAAQLRSQLSELLKEMLTFHGQGSVL